MQYGKDVEALEAMQRAGKHVPALDTRPNILGLAWVWQAFWELSTCRALGTVMGPIPWNAIHEYCLAYSLDDNETALLHAAVRHMDNIWLEKNNEIAKARMKQQTKPQRGKHGSSRR